MLSWPALLLAPLIVLCELSIAYALVTPSCASQDRSALHAVAAASLLIVLGLTMLAWREWRGHGAGGAHDALARHDAGAARMVTRADSDSAEERPRFIAQLAVAVGALSALVCVALWVPIWLLSPCS
jgi:hypothetical protein